MDTKVNEIAERTAGYRQELGTSDRRQAAFEATMREDDGA